MKKNYCFVIMGFGTKTDFATGRTLDLNKTYKNIIKPAVLKAGFECIRADEIQDSGIIDKSMYGLLMYADLVIADISTYNPNAIYELGVRHAVKPFSTIIIQESDGIIPFDLNHNRIFKYSHLGIDIGVDESERCILELSNLINKVFKNKQIDSPLYEYLPKIKPPKISEEELEAIFKELADKEKHIFAVTEEAENCMRKSKFLEAKEYWLIANKMNPNDSFIVQQLALSTYKSKQPSEQTALIDALNILEDINADNQSNDPETLGLTGAIYKNLFNLNNDIETLNRAIENYEKGFKFRNDYYTGENYALCLNIKADKIDDGDEKTYCKFEANKVRASIIQTLEELFKSPEFENRLDKKWIFATLSNCHIGLRNEKESKNYEILFKKEKPHKWEIETYEVNRNKLIKLIGE